MSDHVNLVDIVGYSFYQYTFTIALLFLPYLLLWYFLVAVLVYLVVKGLVYAWETLLLESVQGQGRGVFISGCDSGFGFMFAERLDALGFTVFAGCLSEKSQGARHLRAKSSRRLHVVEVDVTKDKSVSNAFSYVRRHLPKEGLWGVVNNAGINVAGEVELSKVFMYQRGFNVNFYGAVRITRESLPLIRKTKGRIINISSTHGVMSIDRQVVYEASKHAMETMTDSLRLEMKKFGVQVSIIEPGAFAFATSIYNERIVKRIEKEIDEMWNAASMEVKKKYKKQTLVESLGKPKGSWPPDDVGGRDVIDAVEHALRSERPRSRYRVWGERKYFFGHLTAALYGVTPSWIMDKFILWWHRQ